MRKSWAGIVANRNAPAREMLDFENDVVLPHMQSIKFSWICGDSQMQEDIEKNATILLSNLGKGRELTRTAKSGLAATALPA